MLGAGTGSGMRKNWSRGLVSPVLVGLLSLSACGTTGGDGSGTATNGSTPAASSASASPSPSPSMAQALAADEVAALMTDYDTRNNAASLAADADFNADLWATADTGGLLESDVFSTALAKAQERAPDGKTYTHTDPVGYIPMSPVEQPWLIVRSTFQDSPSLKGYTRSGSSGPWLNDSWVEFEGTLPEPAAPGQASTPTPAQVAAVQKAIADVIAHVETPEVSPFPVVGGLANHHNRLNTFDLSGLDAESMSMTTEPYAGALEDQGTERGSTQIVVAADGSVLAVAGLRNQAVFTAKAGRTIEHGQDFAEASGETGPREELHYGFLFFVLLRIDPSGAVTMMGSTGLNLPVK